MIKKFNEFTTEVNENRLSAEDAAPNSGKYPLLDDVADRMANDIAKMINQKAIGIENNPDHKDLVKQMPYISQYLLEEVVRHLEKMI